MSTFEDCFANNDATLCVTSAVGADGAAGTPTQGLDPGAGLSEVKRSPIRVLLVDAHVMVRKGLRRLLETEDGFRVVVTLATVRRC